VLAFVLSAQAGFLGVLPDSALVVADAGVRVLAGVVVGGRGGAALPRADLPLEVALLLGVLVRGTARVLGRGRLGGHSGQVEGQRVSAVAGTGRRRGPPAASQRRAP
jgi:hypothetical protein